MTVDSAKNKLCSALVCARSSPVCQLPCTAIRNVHETIKTLAKPLETPLAVSIVISGAASAIVGVVGAAAVSDVLGTTSVITCLVSTLSCGTLTGLVGGTIAHYCAKKILTHAASPGPESENEQILPDITEDVSKHIVINIEG